MPKIRSTRPGHVAGRAAEDLACRYLVSQGLEILARNVRVGRDEIDIVAREHDEIVFVEVRLRDVRRGQTPEESLDRGKRARLVRAAAAFIDRHGLGGSVCRFDLVAIVSRARGWRELRHHRGVFVDDGE